MNWFKNMICRWVRDDWENVRISKAARAYQGEISKIGGSNSPDCPSINFQIYPATGGNVVEINYYDEKADKMYKALHIIPSDQDLGDGISKIITFEMLKR